MISTSHFHPMLVHFPIALVVFGFISDLLALYFKKEACLPKLGFYLLMVGTLAALTAWLTGTLFTSEMSGTAGEVKEIHEIFAWLTLGALVVASALRIFLMVKNKDNAALKWAAFIFYGLSAIFVSVTGFYGGTLVYSYMMPI